MAKTWPNDLLLEVATSPFSDLCGVEAHVSQDLLTNSFRVHLSWSVSYDQLVAAKNEAEAIWGPVEAVLTAGDRARIEAGKTPIVLGED